MTEYLLFDHDHTKITLEHRKLFRAIENTCCEECFAHVYRQTELLFRQGTISLMERYLVRSIMNHDFKEIIRQRVENLRSLNVDESQCLELEKKLDDYRRQSSHTVHMTDAELERPRHENRSTF